MNDFRETILEIASSQNEAFKAAAQFHADEVRRLKGEISVLQHTISDLRCQNIVLKAQLRSLGGDVLTDGIGDSR
jgi:hypothetical protein